MAYLSQGLLSRHFVSNWKIHIELSNDGINGIFDLVITVDPPKKKVLYILVVLKRQIRPGNYYYFHFNIKANIEKRSVAGIKKFWYFKVFKILKIPLDTTPNFVSVKALANFWV